MYVCVCVRGRVQLGLFNVLSPRARVFEMIPNATGQNMCYIISLRIIYSLGWPSIGLNTHRQKKDKKQMNKNIGFHEICSENQDEMDRPG